ncbi:PHD finger protein MALE MEIOCYTE DEATH 1 [Magnolia sinica]|uniref:PHD finger protein MALE MEIOCYTE DEATH 1 n=1 Tax=Magnolia sinica TaxID=86752 RepID=UPI002657C5C9|nr:PHD finger protein MALE MEIOCYTE DEATH 1 [Magnolia sinica]
MSTIFDACKKRKRQIKAYAFHAFADPGCPVDYSGPFRDNIRSFLRECAEIEDYNVEGMPTWCTLLVNEGSGVVVPLYFIEENVKHSRRPFCDFCRCVGWRHHFVSKRRYHIMIPSDSEWDKPLSDRIFSLQNHLLHGLIHCNGFGHLLCINGHEGRSKYIRGREIMDLWDRICTTLRTRKVTVEDISTKSSMELRLLCGVAYGQPWFGRWGYKFCHGTFGVTEHNYQQAIEILSSLDLDRVIEDFKEVGRAREMERIILSYQKASKAHLETIRDLLLCMLELKSHLPLKNNTTTTTVATTARKTPAGPKAGAPKQSKPAAREKKNCIDFSTVAASLMSRWSIRRLELTAQVIVDALKENRSGGHSGAHVWMTRQDVRDAARLHIGDTGLIDFVLKSLGNCIVGDCVVVRAANPTTRVLQYTVKDTTTSNGAAATEPVAKLDKPALGPAERMDINRDMLHVYKHVLEHYPAEAWEPMRLAGRAILHSKHFVKAWPFQDADDEMLRFMCKLMPSAGEEAEELTQPLPPPVLVVVPPHATVGELRAAGEQAFRDTYCILERFEAAAVEGLEGDEEELLFAVAQSGATVWLRGSGVDLRCKLRYEGGADNWTVDCTCGARDDDGERMVACDICEVWQHTRCGGIDDAAAVPPLFVCARCGSMLAPHGHEILGKVALPPEYT